MENSRTDYLTVINSVLILLDYQTNILNGVGSGDIKEIRNAVIASAKAARILHVPVILTSYNIGENGEIIKELSDLFPGKEIINRSVPGTDAFENESVLKAVKRSARNKLIISGLLTSRIFTTTALHGIREGFDVYGLIDAGGDISYNEHSSGVNRMLEAGVTPLTWISLTTEWMNGGTDPALGDFREESYSKYNVMLSYLSRQQPVYHFK